MLRVILVILAVFTVLGGVSAFQFRERMAASRLGSDVTYSIDGEGIAQVEMANKSYFVDGETEKNFDAVVAKYGQPDVQAFQKGVEDSLKYVSAGRDMSVSDFAARFERTQEFGAQVYTFLWAGFASKSGDNWVVDFSSAKPMKFTKDSSLVIVLPPGATLVRAEPAPTAQKGNQLTWTATGELSWPHVEYR